LIVVSTYGEKITSLPGLATLPSYDMYSGYITLSGGANMFYWFIESANNPKTDPIVLWLNGGPGCSSLSGLLEEHGPFFPDKNLNLTLNPYSWNKVANMLYLESPAGVGYSYWPGVHAWTDNETAAINYEFISLWFKQFSQFSTNAFYITGESYAGHYVPTLAYEIYSRSSGSQASVAPQSNFKGYMVGNPSTHMTDAESSLNRYLQYHAMIPLGELGTQADGFYDPYDILVDKCRKNYLRDYIRFPHPFNNYLQGWPEKRYVPNPDVCEDNYVDAYLNSPDVRKALHASDNAGTWSVCANILYKFGTESIVPYYQTFIKSGKYHIVVFSGDADTVVNFVGTEEWIQDLKLSVVEKWGHWNYTRIDGENNPQVGGWRIKYNGIGFVTVKGAGHMVPWYQPAPALELFTQFLKGNW